MAKSSISETEIKLELRTNWSVAQKINNLCYNNFRMEVIAIGASYNDTVFEYELYINVKKSPREKILKQDVYDVRNYIRGIIDTVRSM